VIYTTDFGNAGEVRGVWANGSTFFLMRRAVCLQWRRAIEALEARTPPPDGVATLVNSLQNRVKSITLCVILNAKKWETVFVTLCIQIEWLFIMLSGVKL